MKFAAFVCFCGVSGGESICEDEAPDHACRKGEGTTGAVGFAGERSRAEVGNPLSCGAGVGLVTGGRDGTGEPPDTGNGNACAILFGEGPGAGDRRGCEVLPFVPVLLALLWIDERLCVSSPIFLRLASVLVASLTVWVSFNTRRSEEEREGPNAGDEYRLRERAALALPTPSHLYTPLGFLESVFRGEGVDMLGV
jgi:hypothetical protein